MATIRKRGKSFQAQILRRGYPPQYGSFATKGQAQAWARLVESRMDRGVFVSTAESERTSVAEAVERYRLEVMPRLRGAHAETARLVRLGARLGSYALAALTSSDIAQYRDERLREGASPQTVIHELGLLHRVFRAAEVDWGITLPRGAPTTNVRRPSKPEGRSRRLASDEQQRLFTAADEYGGAIGSVIRLALATAMRRGEIAALRWPQVDFVRRVIEIPCTKNGKPRAVPLTSAALAALRNAPSRNSEAPWSLRADSITQAFERVCRRAGIQGLRFHDLRHEATSRLFEAGLNPMEVASITGHRDMQMLRRYTHPKAEDLAVKLERAADLAV